MILGCRQNTLSTSGPSAFSLSWFCCVHGTSGLIRIAKELLPLTWGCNDCKYFWRKITAALQNKDCNVSKDVAHSSLDSDRLTLLRQEVETLCDISKLHEYDIKI